MFLINPDKFPWRKTHELQNRSVKLNRNYIRNQDRSRLWKTTSYYFNSRKKNKAVKEYVINSIIFG